MKPDYVCPLSMPYGHHLASRTYIRRVSLWRWTHAIRSCRARSDRVTASYLVSIEILYPPSQHTSMVYTAHWSHNLWNLLNWRFWPVFAIFDHFWPISPEMHKAEKSVCVFPGRIFGSKKIFLVFSQQWFRLFFFFFLAAWLPMYLLDNPRFPERKVGLTSGWSGNGIMLFLKSSRVGLDRRRVD